VQLADPVPVHTLDRSVREGFGNLHPSTLEFGFVIAFAAQPRGGDLFGVAELFHRLADDFGFGPTELARLASDGIPVPVLAPLVGTAGTSGQFPRFHEGCRFNEGGGEVIDHSGTCRPSSSGVVRVLQSGAGVLFGHDCCYS